MLPGTSIIEMTGPREISCKEINHPLAQHIDDKVALIVRNCSDDAESVWDMVTTKTVPFDLYKRAMKKEFAIEVPDKAPNNGVTEEYIEEALWNHVEEFVAAWNGLETYKDRLVQKSTITKPLTIGGKQATLWQAVRILGTLGTQPIDTFSTAYLLGIHIFFDVGVHIVHLSSLDPDTKVSTVKNNQPLPAVLPRETKALHEEAHRYTPRVRFVDNGKIIPTGCAVSYEKTKEKWHTPRKLLDELGIDWATADIVVEEPDVCKPVKSNYYNEHLDTPVKEGYEIPIIWAIDDTHMYLSVVTYMGCSHYMRIPCTMRGINDHTHKHKMVPKIELD